MSYNDLYLQRHNQDHRDPYSGAGVHAGQSGSTSLATPMIPEAMATVSYTKDNLMRDLVAGEIPTPRSPRKSVGDLIVSMSAQNNKYFDRSLAKSAPPHVPLELGHLKRK